NGKDAGLKFAQGDVVTTIIKCAHGETISLTLDTCLPRCYSRGFHVQGTRAMFCEDNLSLFLDGEHNKFEFKSRELWGNAETYLKRYEHPIWQEYLKTGIKGGHDGMDWLEFDAFFQAVIDNTPAPIDVYDMAAWMSVSALSEASIAQAGAPVSFPDFTNGKWMSRKPL
ncbi:MAG: gfo/Idh/MocA family oxidoreductase, partial [Treponema sp.]|nr:gfo/Idh/MocA family oxidoreductase [Treponema sp.]